MKEPDNPSEAFVTVRSQPVERRREKLDAFLSQALPILMVAFVAALPVSIAVCQTALGLACLAWIGRMFLHQRSLISRTPLDYFFLAYLAAELISLIFSQDRWTSAIFFRRMLLIPIVYLTAANVRSERLAKILVAALIGVMAVVALWGIQKYLAGIGGLAGRLSLRQHYMTSGGLLMMASLFSVAYALSAAPRRIRLLALLSSTFILTALVFTFTRSSWLGFFGGLLTIGVAVNRKLIVAALLAVVLLFMLGPPSVRERALSIVDPYHPLNIERTYMWRSGLAMIRDYPWTGLGDINLGEIYLKYKSPEAKDVAGHLHNNLLTIGATLGIPGLVVVVALFVKIIAVEIDIVRRLAGAAWFPRSTAVAALACFIGFQINGLFEWNFGDAEIAMLLWFSIGMALASVQILETNAIRRTDGREQQPADNP
jgi:O-antigen ligase